MNRASAATAEAQPISSILMVIGATCFRDLALTALVNLFDIAFHNRNCKDHALGGDHHKSCRHALLAP